MKFCSFLELIRWKNLVIIATTLLIIKYGFINVFTSEATLNNFHFFLFLISNLLLAASGYIINDIFDIETDTINRKNKMVIGTYLTVNQSYNLYFTTNIAGVFIGFYIANYLNYPALAIVPISISFLLYLYSKSLKRTFLVGNITVAFFVGLSIALLGFIDLLLIKNINLLGIHYLLFELILEFSVFAFLINLIREIIKDIEDINGDNELNMKTLPIVIGIKHSKFVIMVFTLLLVSALFYFIINYLPTNSLLFYYFLVAIGVPILYFIFKLFLAKTKSDFDYLSKILKICMVTGIFSLLLISLTVKNVF